MANNRELSQLGSFISVDDSSRNIGIATTATPYVGIGTTNPQYKLDVYGDINFTRRDRCPGLRLAAPVETDTQGLVVWSMGSKEPSCNVKGQGLARNVG